MDNYKGIYYNVTWNQKTYEGGAHFSYCDLCEHLLFLKEILSPSRFVSSKSSKSSKTEILNLSEKKVTPIEENENNNNNKKAEILSKNINNIENKRNDEIEGSLNKNKSQENFINKNVNTFIKIKQIEDIRRNIEKQLNKKNISINHNKLEVLNSKDSNTKNTSKTSIFIDTQYSRNKAQNINSYLRVMNNTKNDYSKKSIQSKSKSKDNKTYFNQNKKQKSPSKIDFSKYIVGRKINQIRSLKKANNNNQNCNKKTVNNINNQNLSHLISKSIDYSVLSRNKKNTNCLRKNNTSYFDEHKLQKNIKSNKTITKPRKNASFLNNINTDSTSHIKLNNTNERENSKNKKDIYKIKAYIFRNMFNEICTSPHSINKTTTKSRNVNKTNEKLPITKTVGSISKISHLNVKDNIKKNSVKQSHNNNNKILTYPKIGFDFLNLIVHEKRKVIRKNKKRIEKNINK